MNSLASLEDSIRQLIARYDSLQQELQTLKLENRQQREEILRSHAELQTLRTNYNRLQTAASMLGDNDQRERAKQQLTYLIQQVDKAMEVLRKE
ncbi:MAG: hypothetical protein J6T32_00780 [Paludibacteraceae bacterium]|nr:hypothetical protein [Paludibacteraceae bacterium]